jgi:hypothetical protein
LKSWDSLKHISQPKKENSLITKFQTIPVSGAPTPHHTKQVLAFLFTEALQNILLVHTIIRAILLV